jgi:hypothetical protein
MVRAEGTWQQLIHGEDSAAIPNLQGRTTMFEEQLTAAAAWREGIPIAIHTSECDQSATTSGMQT